MANTEILLSFILATLITQTVTHITIGQVLIEIAKRMKE